MAGRHKAQRESITIVKHTEVKGDVVENSRRRYTQEIAKEGIRFPQLRRKLRAPRKSLQTVFKANRPNLYA